jgi:sugar-specific transcriptional regulator TrmB
MTNTPSAHESLSLLGIKKTAQDVFAHLLKHGPTLVADIATAMHMPKSTIYDTLSELLGQSLVVEYSDERGKRFAAISAEEVDALYKKKITELTSASQMLTAFMKDTAQVSDVAQPRVRFYFGAEGIRQAFRDTMWHERCKETFLMWSTQEMIKILGPEFSQWHSEQRLRFKVQMYVIRKSTDRKMEVAKGDHAPLVSSKGWSSDRDIRYAPKKTDWSMNYWIYDNTCLFAASGTEQFAFVVHSKEFAGLMKLLWKQMWEVSEE